MIASLTGTPIFIGEKHLILDVRGVGYKVFATPDTLSFAGASDEIFLFVHTVVREDALELFGFRDETSLTLFEKLLTVSGIGPRGALSVLSSSTGDDLVSAIVRGDLVFLTKLSGIGKKTAEKIIIDLKDKLDFWTNYNDSPVQNFSGDMDVFLALEALGYKESESKEAIKSLPKELSSTEEKIREALKYLRK
jgi:Holliday junction DNA helicase RuvA